MWGGVLSWGQPSCIDTTPYFFTSIVFSATLSISAAGPAAQDGYACGFWEENHLHLWGQEKSAAAGGAQGSAIGVQEWPELLILPWLREKRLLIPHSQNGNDPPLTSY